MTTIAERMDAVLGGNVMTAFQGTFACMKIAEEEIKASGCSEEHGQAAFGILCPSEPLRGKCHDVYRAHCKELIERVQAGYNTRLGTKAEVLCCLLAASLKAPLDASGLALAEHLFANCFPDTNIGSDALRRREFYKGQIADDLAEACKRCAVADRVTL